MLAFLSAIAPLQAEPPQKTLKVCGQELAVSAVSGDTLVLSSGEKVLLADIKAPEYWPDNKPYKSWPYSYQSKDALHALTAGQTLSLYCGKKPTNIYGEKVAHIYLENGDWLQQSLLKDGHAFYYPTNQFTSLHDDLKHSEKHARQNHKGLWSYDSYQLISADSQNIKTGWFQFVKGTIASATAVRKTTYLNFGENWRTDFTIQLDAKLSKQLKQRSVQVEALQGKEVEVRGWVEWSGGPKIILSHLDQLEILSVSESR